MNSISYKDLKDFYLGNDQALENAETYFGNIQPSIHSTGFYSSLSWNWGYHIGITGVKSSSGVKWFEVVTQFGTVKAARLINLPTVDDSAVKKRLEYLRGELRAERISYGELAELESLAQYIAPGDVELAEAANIPEEEFRKR